MVRETKKGQGRGRPRKQPPAEEAKGKKKEEDALSKMKKALEEKKEKEGERIRMSTTQRALEDGTLVPVDYPCYYPEDFDPKLDKKVDEIKEIIARLSHDKIICDYALRNLEIMAMVLDKVDFDLLQNMNILMSSVYERYYHRYMPKKNESAK